MALDKKLSRDLSPKTIKQAVLSNAVQKPLTVYGAAAAFLGSGFALMVDANPLVLAAIGVGATLSAANWLWEYTVKGDKNANAFVAQYRSELEQRRREALRELVAELQALDDDQASRQLELFQQKYENFVEVLDRKLTPGELTYNRYLSIAEQVFLGGLDNLENAALAIKSVSAIDVDRINKILKEQQDSPDKNSDETIVELNKRRELHHQQNKKKRKDER